MVWTKYVRRINEVITDEEFRTGVERAVETYEKGIHKLLEEHPESFEYAREVRRFKEEALKNIDSLIERLRENCGRRGINFFYASTREEAREYIKKVVGRNKVIVKSKSMVTEEMDLRDALEELGNEVWETDLGEFIVQIAGDEPMHIVTPSIHYSRHRVAKLLKEKFNVEFDPDDVEGMVRYITGMLREKYFKADVGIVGANAVSVEEPAVVLVHNEGNIRMVLNTPKKLIVVADITKLLPNLEAAVKTGLTASRFSKYLVTGYYDIVLFAKSSLEYGPEEIHLVLVDGGRSELIRDEEAWEAALCIKCGACMYVCTSYQIVGGRFGGKAYPSGIGAIVSSFTFGLEESLPALYTCLLDGRCFEICPMDIDIPGIIRLLRARANSRASSSRDSRRR